MVAAGGEETVGDAGSWSGPEPTWYPGPREDSLPQVRRVRGDARGPPQRSDQGQVGETQESLSRGAKEIVHSTFTNDYTVYLEVVNASENTY